MPQTLASPETPTNAGAGGVLLDRVTKRFGGLTAVDDVSLVIESGEFLSLLGPSGCGKTTTLRMIAGFEHPDEGDIRIGGTSVVSLPPYRRNVNTVFQAYALFPHMTVAENVAYGLQQKRTPKAEIQERVGDALSMVQMRHLSARKPAQLSGGQQQRVALARALVNRPSVLLLDEPLGALDRKLREEMQLELKLIQSELGITFVFVTHDQGEALSMSDRIAVMREGHIEQLADSDTIYSSPASAYVASFVGQQNFFDGRVAADGSLESAHVRLRPATPISVAPVGGAARGAVRPEFVDIAAQRPDVDDNAVAGRVLSISHLGETMQFLVEIGAEQSVLARRPTPDAPRVAVGDPVWCRWRPESIRVFAGDADSADALPTAATVVAGTAAP